MDELFTKYEQELVTLRSLCREFAQRHPKVAAQLELAGDTCNDPHMERLIQGAALLNARVAKRLDDAFPEFTEALLGLLRPHYLRPFPSCAIARVLGEEDGMTAEMPRGTVLESAPVEGVPCTFKTVYDVKPSPVVLADARLDMHFLAPVATRRPEGVTATLTLTFVAAMNGEALDPQSGAMRLYTDGDAPFCAALRDAFFMHARAAYVQLDEQGPWDRLQAIPVTPAGFADEDALIPFDAGEHMAYRLLAEYFAFPDKFNFVDIDMPALLRRIPAGCTRFTLHLALADIHPESEQARILASLSKQHLLQGCTPVVNLFRQQGVAATYHPLSADYPLLAHPGHPQAYEVVAVNMVRMVSQDGTGKLTAEFHPYYSLGHGEDRFRNGSHYWMMRHDEALSICSPGHEKSIVLVDADGAPLEIERNYLSIDLECTNRDLPCTLPIGAAGGDLFAAGMDRRNVIRLLRRPTRPVRLTNASGVHWRLISHMALNHHSLERNGAEGLREVLTLHDFAPTPASRRQIGGILALAQSETTAWMRYKAGSTIAHGIEISLTLDEAAYAGGGLHLFAQVLEQFFALYVLRNSFVELVFLSHQSGKELLRCKPRSGRMAFV